MCLVVGVCSVVVGGLSGEVGFVCLFCKYNPCAVLSGLRSD